MFIFDHTGCRVSSQVPEQWDVLLSFFSKENWVIIELVTGAPGRHCPLRQMAWAPSVRLRADLLGQRRAVSRVLGFLSRTKAPRFPQPLTGSQHCHIGCVLDSQAVNV